MKERTKLPVVLILLTAPLFSGCHPLLKTSSSPVKVAPISTKYRLEKIIEGTVCILPAEASTGQEQFRELPSNSLARVLRENDEGFNIKVLSILDFANELNKNDLVDCYAEMRKFYKENAIFSKKHLIHLGEKLEIDYFIVPRVLDLKRWNEGRLSAVGVKVLGTQKISLVVSLEIWNTKGYAVFSGNTDVMISDETIGAKPISMEEAFETAWLSIMNEFKKGEEQKKDLEK